MRTPDDVYDELLVIRCQEGDAAALAELVQRWQPRLARQAMRLTGRGDEAADVLQEAWLAIVRGIRRLDDPACFRRWAYRILTNKCADWTRRRRRERATQVSLVGEPAGSGPPLCPPQDDVAAIRAALRTLPRHEKAILAMFYLDSMPVRLIADALSLPEGTVKSRLYHARNHLKEVLERRES
jgi:DNA-directed RNA polymerase specialized sigma24 family protein